MMPLDIAFLIQALALAKSRFEFFLNLFLTLFQPQLGRRTMTQDKDTGTPEQLTSSLGDAIDWAKGTQAPVQGTIRSRRPGPRAMPGMGTAAEREERLASGGFAPARTEPAVAPSKDRTAERIVTVEARPIERPRPEAAPVEAEIRTQRAPIRPAPLEESPIALTREAQGAQMPPTMGSENRSLDARATRVAVATANRETADRQLAEERAIMEREARLAAEEETAQTIQARLRAESLAQAERELAAQARADRQRAEQQAEAEREEAEAARRAAIQAGTDRKNAERIMQLEHDGISLAEQQTEIERSARLRAERVQAEERQNREAMELRASQERADRLRAESNADSERAAREDAEAQVRKARIERARAEQAVEDEVRARAHAQAEARRMQEEAAAEAKAHAEAVAQAEKFRQEREVAELRATQEKAACKEAQASAYAAMDAKNRAIDEARRASREELEANPSGAKRAVLAVWNGILGCVEDTSESIITVATMFSGTKTKTVLGAVHILMAGLVMFIFTHWSANNEAMAFSGGGALLALKCVCLYAGSLAIWAMAFSPVLRMSRAFSRAFMRGANNATTQAPAPQAAEEAQG